MTTEFLTVDAAVRRVLEFLQRGRAAPAREIADQLATHAPADARVAYVQALACLVAGDGGPAVAAARRACELQPDNWEFHYLAGRAHRAAEDAAAAIAAYRRAIALNPRVAEVHVSLGIALRATGELGLAASSHRHALTLDPDSVEARNNLAVVLQQAGRPADAEAELQAASAVRRAEVERLWAHAGQCRSRGDVEAARAAHERAVEIGPEFAETHFHLGLVLTELGQYERALPHLERACELRPEWPAAMGNLATALVFLGRAEAAAALFERATGLDPEDGAMQMRAASMLPIVPSSAEEIHDWRRRYRSMLERLCASPPPAVAPDVFASSLFMFNFFLAYHGLDDRPLLETQSRAARAVCPALARDAPVPPVRSRAGRRLRVGFISKYLRSHSIGRTTRGLVAELSRERFEVHALFLPPAADDAVSRFIRERADASLLLPPGIEQARERIAALGLDVLFYQDIGMEPLSYCLAHSRLAPVQCVSFGHPDTTGIPTMDYFVSSDLFEPLESQAHYSERLFLIRGVGTLAYYYRPVPPAAPLPRERFGLHPGEHVYLCPQTLFKVHPEFDALVAGILRRDPDGQVLFIDSPGLGAALRTRFEARIGDVAQRIRFVPGQGHDEFLSLILASDVILDTIHFNGMNTSLQSFALGAPVVTLPKRFQRGRHTYGMYRRMGLEDCVARDEADYVDVAVRLGCDPAYRGQVRRRILASCDVLFEDRAVVAGFEDFFEQACARAGVLAVQ